MRFQYFLAMILSTAFLAQHPNHSPAVMEKVKPEKKPDVLIEQTLVAVFDLTHKFRDVPTRYDYNRVDLNGDGEPEILVHLFSKNMCAAEGCTTVILQKQQNGYKVVTQLGLTRTPVFASQHVTNGWKDLIVLVSGGGTLPGYYAILPFNGRAYPENPTAAPAEPLDSSQPATAYLTGGGKSGFKIALPAK